MGIEKTKRKLIAQDVANYLMTVHDKEVQAVILFCSVSKNKDTQESDIDILVLTKLNLSYDEEYEIIKEIGQKFYGIDEYLSTHFESCENITLAVENGYSFEEEIMKIGNLLAGAFPET